MFIDSFFDTSADTINNAIPIKKYWTFFISTIIVYKTINNYPDNSKNIDFKNLFK